MPAWQSTVAGNTIVQQRQIDKLGTALMGPVAIGPGEGSVLLHDGSTDLMLLDPSGIQLNVYGAMRSLPAIIESKASTTYVDGNVATLRARDDEQQIDIDRRATRTYVDGNISTLVTRANGVDSRLDGLDAAVAARATRTYVDGNISTIVGRLNGHDTAIAARATKTYVDGNVTTLLKRDDDLVDILNLRFARLRAWFVEAQGNVPTLPNVPDIPNLPYVGP